MQERAREVQESQRHCALEERTTALHKHTATHKGNAHLRESTHLLYIQTSVPMENTHSLYTHRLVFHCKTHTYCKHTDKCLTHCKTHNYCTQTDKSLTANTLTLILAWKYLTADTLTVYTQTKSPTAKHTLISILQNLENTDVYSNSFSLKKFCLIGN